MKFEWHVNKALADIEQSKGQKIHFFFAHLEKAAALAVQVQRTSRGISRARRRAPFRGLRLGRQIEAREAARTGAGGTAVAGRRDASFRTVSVNGQFGTGASERGTGTTGGGCWAVLVGRNCYS